MNMEMHCNMPHHILTDFGCWCPPCSGSCCSMSFRQMNVKLVQFVCQLLNLKKEKINTNVCTLRKFAGNESRWTWEDISFFAESIYIGYITVLLKQTLDFSYELTCLQAPTFYETILTFQKEKKIWWDQTAMWSVGKSRARGRGSSGTRISTNICLR